MYKAVGDCCRRGPIPSGGVIRDFFGGAARSASEVILDAVGVRKRSAVRVRSGAGAGSGVGFEDGDGG